MGRCWTGLGAVAAGVLGLAASLGCTGVLGPDRLVRMPDHPEDDTVLVIVAAKELRRGVTVADDDLYAVEIWPSLLPSGVYLSPEHVVGRVVRSPIPANDFVNTHNLADPESGLGLSELVPRGMRLVLLEGVARPGQDALAYVDLWRGQGKQRCSLVQHAFVFAGVEPPMLAVLATPQDAVAMYDGLDAGDLTVSGWAENEDSAVEEVVPCSR